ncbi:ribonuclease HII, partial [Mycoplasmopsis pullorum]
MLEINYDIDYWKENNHILGLDEAGRGAWAGPIVVAGVVLP